MLCYWDARQEEAHANLFHNKSLSRGKGIPPFHVVVRHGSTSAAVKEWQPSHLQRVFSDSHFQWAIK
ncbi:hypothetical protein I308_102567 [Cryptococcus tetragattii IND107]|uniref:Uncharacterized protein n=1 Tax=Cryptococcus tetragattii IND107 TaxID=1296105 RepID=A0ABR3BU74_9TREE